MKKLLSVIFCLLFFVQAQMDAQVFYIHADNNKPVLLCNAGQDKSICTGGNVSIGGLPAASGGVGTITYSWSPSVGLNNPSLPNPIANPATTTTYTLTATDSLGCQSFSAVKVTVNPLPNVIASAPNHYISQGGSTSLFASGAETYTWSPSEGLNTTSGTTVNASPSENTIYQVQGTDSNSCVSTDTVAIRVYCGHCPDTLITANQGIFTNGCDNHVYNNESRCKWLLLPNGASTVFLSFSYFDILPGDKIRVWQGADTTGSLVGSYDNNIWPPATISTTVPMFFEFITNETGVANGFVADYWTNLSADIPETSYSNINIYPNPGNNTVTIETPFSSMIEIFSSEGKRIKTFKSAANTYQMDISTFEKGLYFIKIRSENGFTVKKFIKN